MSLLSNGLTREEHAKRNRDWFASVCRTATMQWLQDKLAASSALDPPHDWILDVLYEELARRA